MDSHNENVQINVNNYGICLSLKTYIFPDKYQNIKKQDYNIYEYSEYSIKFSYTPSIRKIT